MASLNSRMGSQVLYRPNARRLQRRTTATTNYNAPQIVGPGAMPGGRSRIYEDPNDGNWLTPPTPIPAATSPAASATTNAAGSKNVGAGKAPGYTMAGDPFLALLQAQYGRDMGTDRAAALAEKKRLLLAFGSSELAKKVLGQGMPTALEAPLPAGFTRDFSGNGLFNWSANNVDAHGGMVVATRPDGSYSVVFQDRPGREGQAQGSSEGYQAFTPLAAPGPTDKMAADDPFIASVAANPFSSLANIKRQYDEGVTNREDELNKANLHYSGFRGQELARMATGRQQEEATRSGEVEGALSGIDQQILNAERGWQDRMFQAQHDAYLRELEWKMANQGGEDDSGGGGGNQWQGQDNAGDWYSSSPYGSWTLGPGSSYEDASQQAQQRMLSSLIMPNDPRWRNGVLPVNNQGRIINTPKPKPVARMNQRLL